MIKSKKLKRTILKYIILPVFVYVLISFVFALSNSFSETTGYSNESILSFFGSILTTLIAIIGGYIIAQSDKFEDDKKESELMEKIIRVYLANEIKINADIACIYSIKERLKNEVRKGEKIHHGFSQEIVFSEFDKLKFKLLDYQTENGDSVISFYSFLYRLNQKKDYKHFERAEIDEFLLNYDRIIASTEKCN